MRPGIIHRAKHLLRQLATGPEVTTLPIFRNGKTRRPHAGRPLRLLSWNIQYGGGRDRHFFYDGGPDVAVPEQEQRAALAGIGSLIREVDADIVLLQEVDRSSTRTGRLDQLRELLSHHPYPLAISAGYHCVPWVPHPAHHHLGRVDMHLAVLSRIEVTSATRIQLARLDEPLYRRFFNLRRAILDARIPLVEGGELRLMNTHLSAFARGDGTLDKQVQAVHGCLAESRNNGQPALVAGDFNALPPGDDPSRLGPDSRALYPEMTTPLSPLFDAWDSAISAEAFVDEPANWRTYLPPGEMVPDRTLDYVFSHGLSIHRVDLLPSAAEFSDHLPLLVEFSIPEPRTR